MRIRLTAEKPTVGAEVELLRTLRIMNYGMRAVVLRKILIDPKQ